MPNEFYMEKETHKILRASFIFREYLTKVICNTISSRHLLAQSQLWKYQSNVWSLFEVNNKKIPEQHWWRHYDVFVISLE